MVVVVVAAKVNSIAVILGAVLVPVATVRKRSETRKKKEKKMPRNKHTAHGGHADTRAHEPARRQAGVHSQKQNRAC